MNFDTCFVPSYHLVGKAFDQHRKRLAVLIPIDAKLDLLLKAARLEHDPLDPLGNLPGDVVKALQAGQKIRTDQAVTVRSCR